MPKEDDTHNVGAPSPGEERTPRKPLSPAAERALAEAAARRAAIDAHAREVAGKPELQGRGGLEPVRYDDWEINGRAIDF